MPQRLRTSFRATPATMDAAVDDALPVDRHSSDENSVLEGSEKRNAVAKARPLICS
jgi:hypothetical protein